MDVDPTVVRMLRDMRKRVAGPVGLVLPVHTAVVHDQQRVEVPLVWCSEQVGAQSILTTYDRRPFIWMLNEAGPCQKFVPQSCRSNGKREAFHFRAKQTAIPCDGSVGRV